ncbi:hypothetical protein K7G10_002943 [Listeria monocytogenes]|nr:hypothetical protein [Listeria monocytogenes]
MSHFSEYGIKKVVAIDDDFGVTISEDTKIADLKEADIDKIEELADFYHSNKEALISDFFKEEQFEEDEKKDFFEEFNGTKIDYYDKFESEKEILFSKWVPEEIDLKSSIEQLATEEERTFIVLDKVLTVDPLLYEGKLRDTLNLISNVIAKNPNLFFVFFSSQPEQLDSYEDVMNFLTNQIKLDTDCAEKLALHINFVDKKAYDLDDFISALRKSQKANFVNSLDKVYEKSIHTLKDRIWNINHNESLLHYDYLVEGQHIDAIIYEMFQSKFKYSFNEFRNNNYEEVINPIRNSIQKYEKNRIEQEGIEVDYAPYRYRFLKDVNHKVYAQKMELKVSKSDDISYGNIIEIDDKMYLVISQNCDTTIRSSGKRQLQSFNLVEIKEITTVIGIEWLKKQFISYFSKESGKGLPSGPEGRKVFEGMFFSESESTEFERMGFKREYLKQIEKANMSHGAKADLKKLKFQEANIVSEIKEYKIANKEIYSIPCFWLDALLLRKDVDGKLKVTVESIENSKEIRLATKYSIDSELRKVLQKVRHLSKNALKISLDNKLFNPVIPVEAVWNGEDLIGFELINVERKKALDTLTTKKLHKEIVDSQTREAINLEIFI